MAKMKKMLAAALAASMVMGLTACGGSSQPTETKAPENAKEMESLGSEVVSFHTQPNTVSIE